MALMKIAGSVLFTFPEVFLVITVNTQPAIVARKSTTEQTITNQCLPSQVPTISSSQGSLHIILEKLHQHHPCSLGQDSLQ